MPSSSANKGWRGAIKYLFKRTYSTRQTAILPLGLTGWTTACHDTKSTTLHAGKRGFRRTYGDLPAIDSAFTYLDTAIVIARAVSPGSVPGGARTGPSNRVDRASARIMGWEKVTGALVRSTRRAFRARNACHLFPPGISLRHLGALQSIVLGGTKKWEPNSCLRR